MTAAIARLEATEAWDLIYPEHLAKLSPSEQMIMKISMNCSDRVWVGFDDDKVLACWGVHARSLLSDQGYLWLWTTEDFHDHVFMFIRHSRRAVADMLLEFSTLYGVTLCSNERAIRWLKWLGAEFGPPRAGVPFLAFEIRAKHG